MAESQFIAPQALDTLVIGGVESIVSVTSRLDVLGIAASLMGAPFVYDPVPFLQLDLHTEAAISGPPSYVHLNFGGERVIAPWLIPTTAYGEPYAYNLTTIAYPPGVTYTEFEYPRVHPTADLHLLDLHEDAEQGPESIHLTFGGAPLVAPPSLLKPTRFGTASLVNVDILTKVTGEEHLIFQNNTRVLGPEPLGPGQISGADVGINLITPSLPPVIPNLIFGTGGGIVAPYGWDALTPPLEFNEYGTGTEIEAPLDLYVEGTYFYGPPAHTTYLSQDGDRSLNLHINMVDVEDIYGGSVQLHFGKPGDVITLGHDYLEIGGVQAVELSQQAYYSIGSNFLGVGVPYIEGQGFPRNLDATLGDTLEMGHPEFLVTWRFVYPGPFPEAAQPVHHTIENYDPNVYAVGETHTEIPYDNLWVTTDPHDIKPGGFNTAYITDSRLGVSHVIRTVYPIEIAPIAVTRPSVDHFDVGIGDTSVFGKPHVYNDITIVLIPGKDYLALSEYAWVSTDRTIYTHAGKEQSRSGNAEVFNYTQQVYPYYSGTPMTKWGIGKINRINHEIYVPGKTYTLSTFQENVFNAAPALYAQGVTHTEIVDYDTHVGTDPGYIKPAGRDYSTFYRSAVKLPDQRVVPEGTLFTQSRYAGAELVENADRTFYAMANRFTEYGDNHWVSLSPRTMQQVYNLSMRGPTFGLQKLDNHPEFILHTSVGETTVWGETEADTWVIQLETTGIWHDRYGVPRVREMALLPRGMDMFRSDGDMEVYNLIREIYPSGTFFSAATVFGGSPEHITRTILPEGYGALRMGVPFLPSLVYPPGRQWLFHYYSGLVESMTDWGLPLLGPQYVYPEGATQTDFGANADATASPATIYPSQVLTQVDSQVGAPLCSGPTYDQILYHDSRFSGPAPLPKFHRMTHFTIYASFTVPDGYQTEDNTNEWHNIPTHWFGNTVISLQHRVIYQQQNPYHPDTYQEFGSAYLPQFHVFAESIRPMWQRPDGHWILGGIQTLRQYYGYDDLVVSSGATVAYPPDDPYSGEELIIYPGGSVGTQWGEARFDPFWMFPAGSDFTEMRDTGPPWPISEHWVSYSPRTVDAEGTDTSQWYVPNLYVSTDPIETDVEGEDHLYIRQYSQDEYYHGWTYTRVATTRLPEWGESQTLVITGKDHTAFGTTHLQCDTITITGETHTIFPDARVNGCPCVD